MVTKRQISMWNRKTFSSTFCFLLLLVFCISAVIDVKQRHWYVTSKWGEEKKMPQPLISRASNYLPRFGFELKYLLQFLACFPFTIIVILIQVKNVHIQYMFFFSFLCLSSCVFVKHCCSLLFLISYRSYFIRNSGIVYKVEMGGSAEC